MGRAYNTLFRCPLLGNFEIDISIYSL